MDVTITPQRLCGAITPPPSKSQAHRLIIAAALARGESRIENVALSQDILATLSCMETLGAKWEKEENGTLRVCGMGGVKRKESDDLPRFDCGESGSTLRFLIPIVLALAGGGVFTGRGRLMERPQKPYADLFAEKGIVWEQNGGTLCVRGALQPGEYALAGNVSSQFFTGLLFALALLDGSSTLRATTALESASYLDMTIRALAQSGIDVKRQRDTAGHMAFSVPASVGVAFRGAVESDWSQAGFYYAAKGIGNSVDICALNADSAQGDRVIAAWYDQMRLPGDVTIDVSDCPDLVPPAAAMAALREGGSTTRFINAARLRMKESDRLSAVAQVLNALGARVDEGTDTLTLHGTDGLSGATVQAHNDHRIAMMAAIAATRCAQPVTICGAECVKKSYPDFWEDYERLGGRIERRG